jgi:hypothetical protein
LRILYNHRGARRHCLAALRILLEHRGARRHCPAVLASLLALTTMACAPAAGSRAALPLQPAAVAIGAADELYKLSPARVHIRRLGPLGLRLLAPNWSRVRPSDQKTLQATLAGTLSEARVAPFVRVRLREAVAAHADLAAAALEWLRSPLGYDVKFAEATAWSGDKSPEDTFYARVDEVQGNRTPEIRMARIRRLVEVTGALEKTLDLTTSVGTVVARLVNAVRSGAKPLSIEALGAAVARERRSPEVAAAYAPVVAAAMLVRCSDLGLEDIDRYVAFASSDAGRWYHDTLAAALAGAVTDAAVDVEGVLDANARSDEPMPEAAGFDPDALLVALPSGGQVRLLAFARTGPPAQPGAVLRYETSLPLHDSAAVGRQAHEVWETLRPQIESEGAQAAVLQATGSVDGWVFPFASSRKFAWRREQAGAWVALEGEAPAFGAVRREMLWSMPP